MPSPFPGMDPYIESPALWPDFHNNLASAMQAHLNQHIQPHYFARLTPYMTYEIIMAGEEYGIRPDVGVLHHEPAAEIAGARATAVASAPVESLVMLETPLRLHRVEIRTTAQQHVVTVIEILSPVNKRSQHEAYHAYLRKRRDLLHSHVHLLEIDLLRGGTRPPLERPVPEAAYYITLSRVERRPVVEVWPIQLADRLPMVPIPLRAPDADVLLDMGAMVASVYERGAYVQQIDYQQPPPLPPLTQVESTWVTRLLQKTPV